MRILSTLFLVLFLWPNILTAETVQQPITPVTSPEGLFVSPTVSTLGLGIDAGWRANETFGIRLGGNWLSVNFDRTIDDVDYDAEANLTSIGTLIDYHPFQGGFRLTGGLRFNFNNADLTGTPTSDVTIGDETFAASDVGTVEGDVTFQTFAPYLGLGYGATLLEGALTIGFDAGLMYQGRADVELDAEGGALEGNTVLEDNLAIEEENIEDDLEDYVVYPVIGLAFSYRF